MSTLLIGYDLNNQKNYDGLYGAIKSLGTWWHYLDSTWLVVTTHTPKDVRDRLNAYLDSDDELLVIDVAGRGRAWNGGFAEGAQKWLNDTYE